MLVTFPSLKVQAIRCIEMIKKYKIKVLIAVTNFGNVSNKKNKDIKQKLLLLH